MGTKTYITNNVNSPIAMMEETDDEIILCELSGYPICKYIKSDNMTVTNSGAFICNGNVIGMYIPRSP